MGLFDSQNLSKDFVEPQVVNPPNPQYGQIMHFQEVSAGAGATLWKVNQEGQFMGAESFSEAPLKFNYKGEASFTKIYIGGNDVSDSFGEGGVFIQDVINERLDTASKLILGEFKFQDSGALAMKIDDDNGTWLSPTGILSKKAGATMFALDNAGNAIFKGDITGATGTFGSVTIVAGSISWAVVSGTGKPADNATVGAQFGVNISGGSASNNYVNNSGYITQITGDRIVTQILDAQIATLGAAKITGTLTVGQTDAKCTDPNADQTSAHTAAGIAGQGALATLSVIGNAYISGDLYSRRFISRNSDSGADCYVDNDGSIRFKYDGDASIYIAAQSDKSLKIHADNNIVLEGDSIDLNYDDDNDSSDCQWRIYSGEMRFKFTSGGTGKSDAGWTTPASDFAEYFESIDGKEIPVGVTVVLEGDKVRIAKKGEEPIGVISATACFIGNTGGRSCGEDWSGKYLKDDLGRDVLEEADFWRKKESVLVNIEGRITRKIKKLNGWCDQTPAPEGAEIKKEKRQKLNPDWDPEKEYVDRETRPEWNVVGLLGQVRIIKGQPINKRWIKMKEISENVDLYLIK